MCIYLPTHKGNLYQPACLYLFHLQIPIKYLPLCGNRGRRDINRVCVPAVDQQALSSVISHLIHTVLWGVGIVATLTPEDGEQLSQITELGSGGARIQTQLCHENLIFQLGRCHSSLMRRYRYDVFTPSFLLREGPGTQLGSRFQGFGILGFLFLSLGKEIPILCL